MIVSLNKKSLLAALLVVLCSGCDNTTDRSPAKTEAPAASLSLNQWFDARYEEELQFSPIELSVLGRKDRNDE